jgi:signal transduction histidine kinase
MLHVTTEKRSDGGVTYLFVDETERLALETEYRVLNDVQRETLDSLKEGVAVFGTDGRLKLSNSAFAAIWNLSRRALAEGPHVDEIITHARTYYDDAPTWTRISGAVTSISEQREAFDGQMMRPDNTIIDYAAMPLPDGATLLTFADVTDAKSYQRALEERNEALVAADRMKNEFIGHVSYELRTPLTNIIGFSELLGNPQFGLLNDKQHEYLEDISASSKTLLAIIDDILTLATMDAGAMELKLGPVDVRNVIDAAILGVREAALRSRLTLHIEVADDATQFIADDARVRQILYNLLSNAVGFSKAGDSVRVTCRREGGMMVFTVEDHGIGIPKDQQWRVFERFESRSHGSGHRGAGLGLSIVKALV